jgi:hypothetical protein
MLSPDNRIGHEEPAGRVNKEGELGVNKRLLAGFPCGFIMFGMISLAEATEIPIHDHFDDAQLDPAWAISFSQVTSWSYTESGTVLSVTDMASTGTGWTSVNLSRHLAAPLSDFNIDFQFSWDSGGDTRSMQNVLVQAYAQDGTKIAEAGYSDGWIGSGGARYGMIGQSLIDTGPDSIASFGSASVTINRIVDVVDIIWDGASLISGLQISPVSLLGRNPPGAECSGYRSHVHIDMDVTKRTAQGAGLGAFDQPQCNEFCCILVHTFHVTPKTACKFANPDRAAVVLQGLHDGPAPFGQPSKEGCRRFEVQGLSLIGRGCRCLSSLAQGRSPV